MRGSHPLQFGKQRQVLCSALLIRSSFVISDGSVSCVRSLFPSIRSLHLPALCSPWSLLASTLLRLTPPPISPFSRPCVNKRLSFEYFQKEERHGRAPPSSCTPLCKLAVDYDPGVWHGVGFVSVTNAVPFACYVMNRIGSPNKCSFGAQQRSPLRITARVLRCLRFVAVVTLSDARLAT
jgi:hypothetical protein